MEEVTPQEVTAAAERMKTGKAAGEDGVTPEAMKLVVRENVATVAKLMNGLIRRGVFPQEWKIARLVLIPKSGNANAYRPIFLLNTMAKLFEAVILYRLEIELQATGELNSMQFGFRKGRSSVGAI